MPDLASIEDWVLDLSAKTAWRVLVVVYLLVQVVIAFIPMLRWMMSLSKEQREHFAKMGASLEGRLREPVEPLSDPAVITMAGFLPEE